MLYEVIEEHRMHSDESTEKLMYSMHKINRKLMNLLGSIRSYDDHSGKSLKKNWDNQPEMLDAFVRAKNEVHKAESNYRILCMYRNFMQHYDVPINSINLSHRLIRKPDGNYSHDSISTIGIFIMKADLLAYNDWRSAKPDIEALPERVDVQNIILSGLNSLIKIHKTFREYSKEHTAKIINLYNDALNLGYEKAKEIDLHERLSVIVGIMKPEQVPDNRGAFWIGDSLGEHKLLMSSMNQYKHYLKRNSSHVNVSLNKITFSKVEE